MVAAPQITDETFSAKLIRLRREIHANPELSNREIETTALIRRELEAAGVSRIYPLEHSGLIAEIAGSRPGAIVAVRADLDALPIQEAADVPFRSRRHGVMHACGHDVHAAMVLGVALAAQEEMPVGTIRLIFQPAEEAEPLGARKVIAAGFVADVCGVIALHVDPGLATGRLALRNGPMMASSDVFTLIVSGRHAHAGWPQDGVDTIAAAAAVISHAQAALTRRVDPRVGAVIHFGRINGGTANNVVADRVQLDGVIRTLEPTVRDRLADILKTAASAASAIYGASCEVEITAGEPVLTNDPWLSDRLRAAGREVLGAEGVLELEAPTMNSEDFAFYGQHAPVAMAWIGVRNEETGATFPLHHPHFAVDESAIANGSAILLQAANDILRSTGGA